MQTQFVDIPRLPSPVDRREGSYLIAGQPQGDDRLAYVVPQCFNYAEHHPERGQTLVRTTVEEYGGLVVTVTTKIQRLHPDNRRPQRPGPSVIATVPEGLVVPTPEEEQRGHFYRHGNMYVALDMPSDREPPQVVGVSLGNTSNASTALHDGSQDAFADTSSLSSEWDASSLSDGSIPLTDNTNDTATATASVTNTGITVPPVVLPAVIPNNTTATVSGSSADTNNSYTPGIAPLAPVPAAPPTIPSPNTIEPPAEVPEGTRFYVVYVGREVGIYWGDWYEVCERLVKGVSGHRATKHSTFSQALVEYTRAYYNQKPGYTLRIATDPLPAPVASQPSVSQQS
ncbi:hypothetical protein VNI00_017568 [Paramarasmius palmivorus]|uniref:Ribonuclease H1 N-terminal domain-containing protein n=1 Tax=Paramarasmius palmivorus TaxID=297713 RepID=A0AAW0B4R8_9AGAR